MISPYQNNFYNPQFNPYMSQAYRIPEPVAQAQKGLCGMIVQARRHYTETKELHRGNTAEDKEHKMRDLEKLMQELATDITELVADASTEERALLRQKLQVLAQKIQ